MAEAKPGSRSSRSAGRQRRERSDDRGGGGRGGDDRGDGDGDRRISAKEVARQATDYLDEMVGRAPEAVTLVEPNDQGWLVEVEILELARIPASTDVLASYEVELDHGGEPLAYRRVHRHYRAHVNED